MRDIGILVGEDADLPKNLIKKLSIITFPFVVEGWRGYKFMRGRKEDAPKTSQPSVKTFEKLFSENLKTYEELLVITISSLLSGTYNCAIQAKKLLGQKDEQRVHIIDSKISTGGEGLIVLKALEMINAGASIKEMLSKLSKYISNTYLLGVFDDPLSLQRGGRISMVQAFVIKNMLKTGFRPILTVKDGKIVTKKIQREKDKAKGLFLEFKEEICSKRHAELVSASQPNEIPKQVRNDNIRVAITHGDCQNDANILKKLVQSFSKNIKIEYVNEISPVIGAHLGPGSLIISWMGEI